MELEESVSVDDYFETARQIFDYCGAKDSETLHVSILLDKFAPFHKTNKAEFSCLRMILDPNQCDPEINVTQLAMALKQYTENQKKKNELDESFNLRMGPAPHDSDSGISSDGFQTVEDLQSELREKSHLAQRLRSQLEFTDRQHEEALTALIAERDSLQTQISVLREENSSLQVIRREYEDVCDRLCTSEQMLEAKRRETETSKKNARMFKEQVSELENEKITLHELLVQSKNECHRINEMYANRQSALLKENETLRAEHDNLMARIEDQDEYMKQILKEKVTLEMELKDMLNRSNQNHTRFDRSIDISYTDDQYMLTALDSLNADSRFSQDYASVSTQADEPCSECVQREVHSARRSPYKCVWEAMKCLFQVFAVLCFIMALLMLYGVTRRSHASCSRDYTPWRWLQIQDLMDFLFTVEYVTDVPM